MTPIAKYNMGFYYEQLDIDHQYDYKALAAGISAYQTEAEVSDMDEKALRKVVLAVKYDNPELFYWDTSELPRLNGGKLYLQYKTESAEEAKAQVQMLREKRNVILNDLKSEGDCSGRELLERVYMHLVKNVSYADDELQKPGCAPWIYDIQGPLLKERGVCLGIAQTLLYLCRPLHIPMILVTGEATIAGWKSNHAWNLVKLDEEWYHADVTGEICDHTSCFLLKDEDFSDRSWPKSIYSAVI